MHPTAEKLRVVLVIIIVFVGSLFLLMLSVSLSLPPSLFSLFASLE